SSRDPLYKARHLSLNRIVCLQMLAGQQFLDAARLAQLRAKAEAVGQLHHANIVEVYDFGELGGQPYFAREYVDGSTLADSWAGSLHPPEQVAELVETLARALHHAHLHGLRHSGLCPSNILIASDGTPKLIGSDL